MGKLWTDCSPQELQQFYSAIVWALKENVSAQLKEIEGQLYLVVGSKSHAEFLKEVPFLTGAKAEIERINSGPPEVISFPLITPSEYNLRLLGWDGYKEYMFGLRCPYCEARRNTQEAMGLHLAETHPDEVLSGAAYERMPIEVLQWAEQLLDPAEEE